jgi:prophage maintenance system killer protein
LDVESRITFDGNKRTGLLAGCVFRALSGHWFASDEVQTVMMILAAAASEIDEAGLAKWFADKSAPK